MNKKVYILLAITIIILIGAVFYWNFLKMNQKDSHGCLVNKGYSWCDFKNKCIKQGEEDCNLTQDWLLNEAKKIIGLDLNLMPSQFIKWNIGGNELVFSAEGYYYTDLLKAEKIIKGFEDWNNLLKQNSLEGDPYNPAVNNDKEHIVKYKREKIVCMLSQTDNPNGTSSLRLFCGNIDDKLCDFKSDCGRKCSSNSDCDFIVDGCRKIIVCRAKNYKFYNDCTNPTSNVSELDVSINSCLCLENQCVPKNEKLRSKN